MAELTHVTEYCTLTGVEYQAVCDLAAGGDVEQLKEGEKYLHVLMMREVQ